MPELPGAGRLESETLAAYIDGLLPPEERARVEAEIAADPETYEWVVNTVRAVEDETLAPPVAGSAPVSRADGGIGGASEAERGLPNDRERGRVLPFYRRRWFVGGAGTLLTAAAALLLVVRVQPEWWQRMRGPQVDPRFAKLVEAVGEERYIEARLSGGFKYGPLRQITRGAQPPSAEDIRVLAITGDLRAAARESPTAANLHASGVALLLVARQLDDAVDALESALRHDRSPRLASDLAAARLTRGLRDGSSADFIGALDLLGPDTLHLPEARYNRALALDFLGAWAEAAAAWDDVARSESDSGWRGEAARRAAAARERAVTR